MSYPNGRHTSSYGSGLRSEPTVKSYSGSTYPTYSTSYTRSYTDPTSDFRPPTRYASDTRSIERRLASVRLSTASSDMGGNTSRYNSSVLPSLSPSSGIYNKYNTRPSSSISPSGASLTNKYSTRAPNRETPSSIRTITGDLTDRDTQTKQKRGGLRNIGNSCYLNSVLQCLLHCEPMQAYLSNGSFERELNSSSKTSGKVAKYAANLFDDLLSGCTGNPSQVKNAVSKASGLFRGTSQEDAQEFLRWFLEALHEDVSRVRTKPRITQEPKSASEAWRYYTSRENSSIVDMCVGQLKSSLTCSTCSYVSEVWDPFWDLSLPLSSSARTIDDCLREFQREETLDGSEKPYCERCKTRRRMTKKFSIEKCPKLLVIHLKRFGDSSGYSRRKITQNITFPPELRLDGKSYELRGVCNHFGGVGGGHYTACGKTSYGWFDYNDSQVTQTSSVQTKDAYLLFYTRAR